MHLQEISEKNKETIETIESSSIVVVFDENEPHSYEETSQLCVNGDFHSKWADRSSTIIAFKNGRFAYVGEVCMYIHEKCSDKHIYVHICIYTSINISGTYLYIYNTYVHM